MLHIEEEKIAKYYLHFLLTMIVSSSRRKENIQLSICYT